MCEDFYKDTVFWGLIREDFVEYKEEVPPQEKPPPVLYTASWDFGAPLKPQIWAFSTSLAVIALPWNSAVHQHSQC